MASGGAGRNDTATGELQFAQDIVDAAKKEADKNKDHKGKGMGGGKGSQRPQPWPQKERGTPPQGSTEGKPEENGMNLMEEETMKEDDMSGAEDTYGFDLTKELQEVVDMTTTDNDGHETIDTSNKIDLRKDTERTTRKQRVQKEEEEGGETTRSRSRPQPPKGAPPAPQHPQHKRSLKGARSNPNDEKHLA